SDGRGWKGCAKTSLKDLRNGCAGWQDGLDYLLAKRGCGTLDLVARNSGRALNFGLRGLNLLPRLLACVLESSLALSLQALHLLFTKSEQLSAGRAKLFLVGRGFSLGGGDGAAGLLHRTRGACATLGQRALERAADQDAVGNDQQDEKDSCRHSAEQQTTKLAQNFHVVLWVGKAAAGDSPAHCAHFR